MTNNVWFITGAGRGMGLDITKAALAADHKVVTTGRNTDKVAQAVGESANLLVVKLDVTNPANAESAVKAVIDRFGRIDVLVNNAASFYAGYFEEITPEQMGKQLATSLIGPINVTRAFLPIMRKQRSGRIISISSSAGLTGFEYCTAYSASKFGLEGWMESLQAEVEPFGIQTMVVNPASSVPSFSPRSQRLTLRRPSRTTKSATRSSMSSGRHRTVSSPATRPSSLRR